MLQVQKVAFFEYIRTFLYNISGKSISYQILALFRIFSYHCEYYNHILFKEWTPVAYSSKISLIIGALSGSKIRVAGDFEVLDTFKYPIFARHCQRPASRLYF